MSFPFADNIIIIIIIIITDGRSSRHNKNNSSSRSSRHHMLDDLVARALIRSCWGPSTVAKDPVGLVRQDGKRPDSLTLIPFEGGRSLTWDVTVVCSTAESSLISPCKFLAVTVNVAHLI